MGERERDERKEKEEICSQLLYILNVSQEEEEEKDKDKEI